MGKPIEMIGVRFGRLTAIERIKDGARGKLRFRFLCECGNTTEAIADNVRRGQILSCGCLRAEVSRVRMTTHGHAPTGRPSREYIVWRHVIARCENPEDPAYKDYGARGIGVCKRWRDSFENFLADMGFRPRGLSIERIDNNKGYEPGNCKWANPFEQARNRRNNISITHNGKTMVLSEWASHLGLKYHTLYARITTQGMSFDAAISIPVRKHKPRRRS
jgi:hypothetical protein